MRFESAKLRGQRCILQYMVPWLRNIELEMSTQWPMASHGFPRQSAVVVCEDSWRTNVPLPSGSASVEATEMVLNNLFYITVKVCVCMPCISVAMLRYWPVEFLQ